MANLVTGYGPEAGSPLVTHPDVDMVSFTGSRAVGTHIATAAGAQLKHVSLEMGGKNALVVLDDADLDEAVKGALWGGFSTSGQRCTASSRLVVDVRVADQVVERLAAGAAGLVVGDGLDPTTTVGPIINQKQLDRVHSYTEIGIEEGARLVMGGEKLDEGPDGGYFYAPTIFDHATPDMRISQEEIFGPTITVIRVDGDDEAIAVANGTRYGLSAAVYTRDTGRALRAVSALEAGSGLPQRTDDRIRDPPPLRRGERHRQRPPRVGHRRDRAVHRDQDGVPRLQRDPAEGPHRRAVLRIRSPDGGAVRPAAWRARHMRW